MKWMAKAETTSRLPKNCVYYYYATTFTIIMRLLTVTKLQDAPESQQTNRKRKSEAPPFIQGASQHRTNDLTWKMLLSKKTHLNWPQKNCFRKKIHLNSLKWFLTNPKEKFNHREHGGHPVREHPGTKFASTKTSAKKSNKYWQCHLAIALKLPVRKAEFPQASIVLHNKA